VHSAGIASVRVSLPLLLLFPFFLLRRRLGDIFSDNGLDSSNRRGLLSSIKLNLRLSQRLSNLRCFVSFQLLSSSLLMLQNLLLNLFLFLDEFIVVHDLRLEVDGPVLVAGPEETRSEVGHDVRVLSLVDDVHFDPLAQEAWTKFNSVLQVKAIVLRAA